MEGAPTRGDVARYTDVYPDAVLFLFWVVWDTAIMFTSLQPDASVGEVTPKGGIDVER